MHKQLVESGLDGGAETIDCHLRHRRRVTVSRATINRTLVRHGALTPDPSERPRSSHIRFEAQQPNETWQSYVTHYRLTRPDGRPGTDVEIISWLDDNSRYLRHVRITDPIVIATFIETAVLQGCPPATLTDNGVVYATRFSNGLATGRHSHNGFKTRLRDLDIVQKNSRSNHPITIAELQTLLDGFVET